MTFLGKEYNTALITVRIPADKLEETYILLLSFRDRTRFSKRALQKLIGKLAFVSECVRSGRLFISRMLCTLP
ncbi:hypothetical protein SNE40_009604 [Patella caerulea]|uniref:Uncharacterized protein n=1 Tax=Patella caerulea TaxID=87958 RepID=A0AAN8JSI5_PATCE